MMGQLGSLLSDRVAVSEMEFARLKGFFCEEPCARLEEFIGRKKKIGFGLIIEATMGTQT